MLLLLPPGTSLMLPNSGSASNSDQQQGKRGASGSSSQSLDSRVAQVGASLLEVGHPAHKMPHGLELCSFWNCWDFHHNKAVFDHLTSNDDLRASVSESDGIGGTQGKKDRILLLCSKSELSRNQTVFTETISAMSGYISDSQLGCHKIHLRVL